MLGKKEKFMSLIRRNQESDVWGWSPFEQLSTLRHQINRLFESPFNERRGSEFFDVWSPSLDVYEDKDNMIVKAELPGLKKEAIEISFHEGALHISGERKQEEQHEGAETYRSERFYGRFHRTVTLPRAVDVNKIAASYKEGVLTVTLPKSEEAKPKQIEVSVK
jgi:HSP20 family protein